MKATQFIFILVLLVSACGDGVKLDINDNSSADPITVPSGYSGAVSKGQKKKVKEMRMVHVNTFLIHFKASNDRTAKSLWELIAQGYLGVISELCPSEKWHYDQQTGKTPIVPAQ